MTSRTTGVFTSIHVFLPQNDEFANLKEKSKECPVVGVFIHFILFMISYEVLPNNIK